MNRMISRRGMLSGAVGAAAALSVIGAAPRPAKGSGRLIDDFRIYSGTLGRSVPHLIYLPADYDSSQRYPLLYMLHGLTGDEYGWTLAGELDKVADRLIDDATMPPTIIVMPGVGDSWFVDHINGRRRDAWERGFTADLFPAIDHIFPIVKDRRARAIGGLSMGGFGAIRFALLYPRLFGMALGFSATIFEDPSPTNPYDPILIERYYDIFGDPFSEDHFRTLNVFAALETGAWKADPPRIVQLLGDQEFDLLSNGNRAFHARLVAADVPAELIVVPGNHDWGTWKSMLEPALCAFGAMAWPAVPHLRPVHANAMMPEKSAIP